MLVRLLRLYPELDTSQAAVTALGQSFTKANVAGEYEYFNAPDRATYERPYGRAWYLQLTAELRLWDSELAGPWLDMLRPLETLIVKQLSVWLGSLLNPVRSGVHSQTAFSFGLMLDWCDISGNAEFARLLRDTTHKFYYEDVAAPLGYEPSGEDFLSPALMEADLVRRVLQPEQFGHWLEQFLPNIPENGESDWLPPGKVTDKTDGRLVHLDGLNLSRAWALEAIAEALPAADTRRTALLASAALHAERGLAALSGQHYAGSHWLASFAVYLLTRSSSTNS